DASTAWAPNIPGWTMKTGDKFYVADANKDGKEELFVFNTSNWAQPYLGTLMTTGAALSGSWTMDWINGPGAADWNLAAADKILPVNYEGGAGKADIFIRTAGSFGMVRRTGGGFYLDRLYY